MRAAQEAAALLRNDGYEGLPTRRAAADGERPPEPEYDSDGNELLPPEPEPDAAAAVEAEGP